MIYAATLKTTAEEERDRTGGPNRSWTRQDKALSRVVDGVLHKQFAAVQAKLRSEGAEATAKSPLGKREHWDKELANGSEPSLSASYLKGGYKGMQEFRRVARGKRALPKKSFVLFSALKRKREVSIETDMPEWIDDPMVIEALRKETFRFARSVNDTTANKLQSVLIDGIDEGFSIRELSNSISALSDEWIEGWRSEMIARTETARAYTTGHIEAWRSTGVVDRKEWVAAGDACPFCLEMHGTIISIDENYMEQGDEQEVEFRGKGITLGNGYSDMNGPPRHPNCRCSIAPVVEGEKRFWRFESKRVQDKENQ